MPFDYVYRLVFAFFIFRKTQTLKKNKCDYCSLVMILLDHWINSLFYNNLG
jgi:hypothetical protein